MRETPKAKAWEGRGMKLWKIIAQISIQSGWVSLNEILYGFCSKISCININISFHSIFFLNLLPIHTSVWKLSLISGGNAGLNIDVPLNRTLWMLPAILGGSQVCIYSITRTPEFNWKTGLEALVADWSYLPGCWLENCSPWDNNFHSVQWRLMRRGWRNCLLWTCSS